MISLLKGDYTRAAKIHLEMLDIFNGIFIAPNPVPIKKL